MLDVATPTSTALRERCSALWQSLLDHRFVGELAAGTLPLRKFRFYIEQDILFLDSYARAIGLAIGRTSSEEELRDLSRQLTTVVEQELGSERALLQRVDDQLGDEREGVIEPAPTTVSYSNFLLATAARGDALDVMTALLPCAWSYADIGRKYVGSVATHPVYSDWIRLFGGSDYVEYVERRLASFDRFVQRASPARRERLFELFATATRLEGAFWDMAYQEEGR